MSNNSKRLSWKHKGTKSKLLNDCPERSARLVDSSAYYVQYWALNRDDKWIVLLNRYDLQYYVSARADFSGEYDIGPFKQPKTALVMCRIINATYSDLEEYSDANPSRYPTQVGKSQSTNHS